MRERLPGREKVVQLAKYGGRIAAIGAIALMGPIYERFHPPTVEAAARDCVTGFEAVLPDRLRAIIVAEDAFTGEILARESITGRGRAIFNADSNDTLNGRRAFRGRIYNEAFPEVQEETVAPCGEGAIVNFTEEGVPSFPRQPSPRDPLPRLPAPRPREVTDIVVGANTVNVDIQGTNVTITSPQALAALSPLTTTLVLSATNPITNEVAIRTPDNDEGWVTVNVREGWWLPASILGAAAILGLAHLLRGPAVVYGGDGHRSDTAPIDDRRGYRRWGWSPFGRRREEGYADRVERAEREAEDVKRRTDEAEVKFKKSEEERAKAEHVAQTEKVRADNLEGQNRSQAEMIGRLKKEKEEAEARAEELAVRAGELNEEITTLKEKITQYEKELEKMKKSGKGKAKPKEKPKKSRTKKEESFARTEEEVKKETGKKGGTTAKKSTRKTTKEKKETREEI